MSSLFSSSSRFHGPSPARILREEERSPPKKLRENLTTRDFSGKSIDLQFSDASLQEVVSRLEREGGGRLDLDPTIEDKVTYQLRQIPWDEALATVLADSELSFDIDMAGNGFKISRGEKSVLVFNNPVRLRRFLFLYHLFPEILAAGFILMGAGIGWRLHGRGKGRHGPARRKSLLSAEDAEIATGRLLSLLMWRRSIGGTTCR